MSAPLTLKLHTVEILLKVEKIFGKKEKSWGIRLLKMEGGER